MKVMGEKWRGGEVRGLLAGCFSTSPHLDLSTKHSRRAFSLLEVVIALTILAIITTTLFAIIKGSVKGASDIERLQRENDQINRFLELTRQTFQGLPGSAQLTLTALGQTAGSGQELTIAGVPTCFGFGLSPTSYEDTIIGLRPDLVKPTTDEDGLPRYTLSISRKDIIPQTDENGMALQQSADSALAADEEGRYWMPLLPGVVLLQWKFFKESTDEWLEEWEDSTWPDMIEMQLQMEGRTVPLRMVWATPETKLRLARAVNGTGTTSSSTSTSTSTTTTGTSTPR